MTPPNQALHRTLDSAGERGRSAHEVQISQTEAGAVLATNDQAYTGEGKKRGLHGTQTIIAPVPS
jgi:hypothetical protein